MNRIRFSWHRIKPPGFIRKYPILIFCLCLFVILNGCNSNSRDKSSSNNLVREIHGAPGIYPIPPIGHFNTFITNAITLGIYGDVVEQPLAMYVWKENRWKPVLATNWTTDEKNNTFTVHLRKGVQFHDGSNFTADDVVTTFYIGYLMNWAVWKYIDKVTKLDPHTVVFHVNRPSSVMGRYVLRQGIRANSVYGQFAKRIIQALNKGLDFKSDEIRNIRKEIDRFRPPQRVGTGPFILQMKNITESEVDLFKFPKYWDADKIHFDKLVLYNGETPAITPLVLAKEVDYATHGFPPATQREFIRRGIRIIRPPIYSGTGIAFNESVYPLNRKEVRQAIAYALNRDQTAYIAAAESAKKQVYLTGFSDNLVPLWLDADTMSKLNRYDYNPQKAADILLGLGFKKGADGIWLTDKGKPMQFDYLCALEYADAAGMAENVVLQLNNFGFKMTLRGEPEAQYFNDLRSGRFQLSNIPWGTGHPHPHFSYYADLITYNYPLGQGPGINFPMKQTTRSCGKIDFEKLIYSSVEGTDIDKQKEIVEKLALGFNELLPELPVYERYGVNPVLEGVRIKPLPAESPYYKNSFYSDNFFTMMLMDGTVLPVR